MNRRRFSLAGLACVLLISIPASATAVIHAFHEGCLGCSNQENAGPQVCLGCCFFEADWGLPDLNDSHARKALAEQEVRECIRRGGWKECFEKVKE